MASLRTFVLAIVVAVVGSAVLAGATAQASGTGAPPGGRAVLASSTDYCGVAGVFDVPDSGPSFDFSQACAGHDVCYAQHHGEGEAARAACDNTFLQDMLTWCNDHWSRSQAQWYQCRSVAAVYYTGVRVGGWLFFYG